MILCRKGRKIMSKLRDHFWIWAHPTNAMHLHVNKAPLSKGVSTISPVDGLDYIGATNLFYCDFIRDFDMRLEGERSKHVPEVGWAIKFAATKPENVTKLVTVAKEYPNIKHAIFDDFFSPSNTTNNFTNYTLEQMAEIRDQLHAAGLEFWVVFYSENVEQFGIEKIRPYLKMFDGVTYWFWDEKDVADYDKHIDLFLRETEGQKRMIGCYLFNFCTNAPVDGKLVIEQLEKERQMLKDGTIQGVVLHTNTVFGLKEPFEAVEMCKAWMEEHGDETI